MGRAFSCVFSLTFRPSVQGIAGRESPYPANCVLRAPTSIPGARVLSPVNSIYAQFMKVNRSEGPDTDFCFNPESFIFAGIGHPRRAASFDRFSEMWLLRPLKTDNN